MCAPCKILLNSGHLIAGLEGFEKARMELHRRGFDFADSTYHRAIELVCGWDDAIDELLALAENGPHVPYKREIIPSKPRVASGRLENPSKSGKTKRRSR